MNPLRSIGLSAVLYAVAALAVSQTAAAQTTDRAAARGLNAPSFRDERRWHPETPPAAETRDAKPPINGAAPGAGATATDPGPASQAKPQAAPPASAAECAPATLRTSPLDAGRMRLSISSPCRRGQPVTLVYGGGEFAARLDGSGSADVTLDCFAGNATPVEVRFQDETSASAAVEALDLDKVSKIAILWRADANLDLHAFEYAAAHGGAGHVSPAAASSLAEVRARTEAFARGHGFLSSVADAETSAGSGDRVEVYTFLHREGQSAGQVAFAVDYETRGAMPASIHCGDGALASVPFRIVTWSRRGIVTREAGAFAPAACGAELAEIARFATTQLPALRARW